MARVSGKTTRTGKRFLSAVISFFPSHIYVNACTPPQSSANSFMKAFSGAPRPINFPPSMFPGDELRVVVTHTRDRKSDESYIHEFDFSFDDFTFCFS